LEQKEKTYVDFTTKVTREKFELTEKIQKLEKEVNVLKTKEQELLLRRQESDERVISEKLSNKKETSNLNN